MMNELDQAFEDAIWVCKSLFERGKVSGSAANMSFVVDDTLYITASGSCFGRLSRESFSRVSIETGEVAADAPKPSKELPLHQMCYQQHPEARAVIHTHSPHATWWTFQPCANPSDAVPSVTPYLRMSVGAVPLIPYAPPGSKELFALAQEHMNGAKCCLLQHHGAIICAEGILKAFYGIEELEETARMLYLIKSSTTNE